MPIRVRANLFLAFSLCTGTLIAQQTPSPASQSSANITLDVVVSPKSGPPVGDLQASDFTVLDNKVPQRVTSFHALGAEAPVHVIVLVDAVNVSYETIAYQRGEIEKFFRANGGQLAHPTHWGSSPTQVCRFRRATRQTGMN